MAKVVTTNFGTLAIITTQAEIPITEDLEWLTDLIEADDSTESRTPLRSKPRQSFKYSLPVSGGRANDVINTLYGNMRSNWAIPVWTEAQYVGNIASGVTSVECDREDYDYRTDGLALLVNGCNVFEVLNITTLGTGVINFSPALSQTINNAFILPIRIGWINGSIDRSTNAFQNSIAITFDIDDTPSQYASVVDSTFPQYLGDDIYYDAPLLDQDTLDTSQTQQQDILDYDLGIVFRRSTWNHSRLSRPYRSLWASRAEINAYKKFLFRRQGQFRQFWYPTFENDLRLLNTGTIASILSFQTDSFLDYALNRTHVAVQADGVWYPRAISGAVATSSTTAQVTMDSALGIPALSVTRVCFLALNRLDADLIELTWNNGGTVEANVQVTEL